MSFNVDLSDSTLYGRVIAHFYPADSPLRRLLLKHSSQVAAKALAIAVTLPAGSVDEYVVINGAMLHDIGIKECHAPGILCYGDRNYICHGTIGADMLRKCAAEWGIDLELYARICERHTGSGITADEVRIQALPLPVRDYLPETGEEKLIALADKFFSKSGDMAEKPFGKVRRSMAKFGPASLARFDELCELFGVKENAG